MSGARMSGKCRMSDKPISQISCYIRLMACYSRRTSGVAPDVRCLFCHQTSGNPPDVRHFPEQNSAPTAIWGHTINTPSLLRGGVDQHNYLDPHLKKSSVSFLLPQILDPGEICESSWERFHSSEDPLPLLLLTKGIRDLSKSWAFPLCSCYSWRLETPRR